MQITKIDWDNIYLMITVDEIITEPIYLINSSKETFQIHPEFIDQDTIRLPITYPFKDAMLDEGTFRVFYQNSPLKIDLTAAKNLDEKSRTYFYGGTTYTYIVYFTITEKQVLKINTIYMIKNRHPNRKHPFLESNNRKKQIKNLATVICNKIVSMLYTALRFLHPKTGKNILLMSEARAPISGNLKKLDERIKERKLPYHVYHFFVSDTRLKKIIINHFKLAFLLAKMDYVFIDDHTPIFTDLTLKHTKLIQVWHAGVGFKNVGYARFGKKSSPWPARNSHRKYDYMAVASPNLIPVYQELTGLQKEHFLVTGMLRLDGYLDPQRIVETKERIYEKYPSLKDKRVILFAPTFRGSVAKNSYYDYSLIDQDRLYEVCKGKYQVLFKFHPFIKKKFKIKSDYSDVFLDVTKYPDINELFYITDVLITDYSSNIYEYSLFEKPIIFFDYDMEEYAIIRGVHRRLEDSPGNVCKTFEEVLETIEKENYDIEKVKQFKKENYAYTDSGSCDRLIDAILPAAANTK